MFSVYVKEDQLFGAPDRDICHANYLVAGCSMKIQQFPSVKEKDREQALIDNEERLLH